MPRSTWTWREESSSRRTGVACETPSFYRCLGATIASWRWSRMPKRSKLPANSGESGLQPELPPVDRVQRVLPPALHHGADEVHLVPIGNRDENRLVLDDALHPIVGRVANFGDVRFVARAKGF